MGGFLFQLFHEKWDKFGHRYYAILLIWHAIYVFPLTLMAFWLKYEPVDSLRAVPPSVAATYFTPLLSIRPLHLAQWLVFAMASRLIWEVRIAFKWLNNYGRRDDGRNDGPIGLLCSFVHGKQRQMLPLLWEWLCSFHFHYQLLSYACTSAAITILLSGVHTESDHMQRYLGENAPHDSIWMFLGISNLTGILVFARLCFIPVQSLGVLSLTISRMMTNDVKRFMMLFIYILANFYGVLYIIYPRAGAIELPQAPQFNKWNDALLAMVNLGFIGDGVELQLRAEDFFYLSKWQRVDLIFFVGAYVSYTIVSVVLLLNLLIAMMQDTYAETTKSATLEWRLSFARLAMRPCRYLPLLDVTCHHMPSVAVTHSFTSSTYRHLPLHRRLVMRMELALPPEATCVGKSAPGLDFHYYDHISTIKDELFPEGGTVGDEAKSAENVRAAAKVCLTCNVCNVCNVGGECSRRGKGVPLYYYLACTHSLQFLLRRRSRRIEAPATSDHEATVDAAAAAAAAAYCDRL